MASNSVDGPQRRKRRPPGVAGGEPDRTDRRDPPDAEPDRTDRRDPPDAEPDRSERRNPPDAADAELSRSERRNQAARAALAPLAPGERPAPLLVAIAVAGLLGAGNAIAYAAGAKIASRHPGAGVLAFTAVMAVLAGGMFARRYLAVLAFEALLAVTVMFFSLFLVEASNLEGVLLCVGVIGAGGWLFWKLVRVMGRLSAPRQSSS
jgi:hypothetical protein